MKLKLTASGFDTYTGQMGVLYFKDGLSVNDVLPSDAVRVAGIIGAEWEDGSPANVLERSLQNQHTPAPTDEQQRAMSAVDLSTTVLNADQAIAQAQAVAEMTTGIPTIVEEKSEPLVVDLATGFGHTKESLGALVDEKGIAGLRAVAEGYDVKSNSINGLIEGILAKVGA